MNLLRWFKNSGSAVLVFTIIACNSQPPSLSLINPDNSVDAKRSFSDKLLYASDNERAQVLVFSYPSGSLMQTLTGFAYPPYFICSDDTGDVFVPTTDYSSPGYIYEFAHGGTQPVETLNDPGPGHALSCSVDPTTGNLAIANGPNVAVYAPGQGTPTIYEASDVGAYDCAYDDSGDLFVDGPYYGDEIAELPAGGMNFSDIALSKATGTLHLQWWNERLVLYGGTDGVHGPYEIYQVRVSGSSGIVSGPVLLYGKAKHRLGDVEFTLSGSTVIMPEGPGHSLLDLWHYPKGGQAYGVIDLRPHNHSFYGVAISE